MRKASRGPLVPIDNEVVYAVMLLRQVSAAQAARWIGVHRQTLDYVITGRNKRMRVEKRAKLAKVLDVPLVWISGDRPREAQALLDALPEMRNAIDAHVNRVAALLP